MKKYQEAVWAKEALGADERLESCYLELFYDFLKSFWMDNSKEIAILLWKNQLNGEPSLAREYLIALDAIIAHPPPNLIELMQQNGWIILYYEPDPATIIPYTFSEHVEWLTDMTVRWRRIYEEVHFSPAGVLRSVLQHFWVDRSDAMVLDEWKCYVKQAPRKAQIILQKLAAVIDTPPPDLPQLLQRYGWIYLYHDEKGAEPRAYSFSEHVEWLRQITARLCAIYESQYCARDQQWAHHTEIVPINGSLDRGLDYASLAVAG